MGEHTMRTPGRRYWETHWHIRAAGAVAIFLLVLAVSFLAWSVHDLRTLKIHNPHYETNHCIDCHDSHGSIAASDCFTCHDYLTRVPLPSAKEKLLNRGLDCTHNIKSVGPDKVRLVTQLCISCHRSVSGYVAMVNIATKLYVEVDIAATHPIGLMPTESIHPKTLPLSRQTGAINCITCHDPHGTDKRMHLLRLYHPGNGRPADFRPLCNDCHDEGWLPISKRRVDAVNTAPKRD